MYPVILQRRGHTARFASLEGIYVARQSRCRCLSRCIVCGPGVVLRGEHRDMRFRAPHGLANLPKLCAPCIFDSVWIKQWSRLLVRVANPKSRKRRLSLRARAHTNENVGFESLTFSRIYLPSLYFCEESGETNCARARLSSGRGERALRGKRSRKEKSKNEHSANRVRYRSRCIECLQVVPVSATSSIVPTLRCPRRRETQLAITCLPLINTLFSLSPSLTLHALRTKIAGPEEPWKARLTSESVKARGRVHCWHRKRGTWAGGRGSGVGLEAVDGEDPEEGICRVCRSALEPER